MAISARDTPDVYVRIDGWEIPRDLNLAPNLPKVALELYVNLHALVLFCFNELGICCKDYNKRVQPTGVAWNSSQAKWDCIVGKEEWCQWTISRPGIDPGLLAQTYLLSFFKRLKPLESNLGHALRRGLIDAISIAYIETKWNRNTWKLPDGDLSRPRVVHKKITRSVLRYAFYKSVVYSQVSRMCMCQIWLKAFESIKDDEDAKHFFSRVIDAVPVLISSEKVKEVTCSIKRTWEEIAIWKRKH